MANLVAEQAIGASSNGRPDTLEGDVASGKISLGQVKVRYDVWAKGVLGGLLSIMVAVVLGVTQNDDLNDIDLESWWDEEGRTGELLLKVLLPLAVMFFFGTLFGGRFAGFVGADMIEELSPDTNIKEATRNILTTTGVVCALFLTMTSAAQSLDMDWSSKRIAVTYRFMIILFGEAAVRGAIMSTLVLLYMEPLDKTAANTFALENLNYLGEPITATIQCIFYYMNTVILWEFGTDGVWVGVGVSCVLGYGLCRMYVVLQYMSSWKNPEITPETRKSRKEQLAALGGAIISASPSVWEREEKIVA
jgi:hypothetical protein